MEELYIFQYSPQKYLLQVFKQIELRGLVQGVNQEVQDTQEVQDNQKVRILGVETSSLVIGPNTLTFRYMVGLIGSSKIFGKL